MAIVKYKNQSGITYAYESISQWDPVKKQSRPKRKYLGRVDPETGEIIETGSKRGRAAKDGTVAEGAETCDYKSMYEENMKKLAKAEAAAEQLRTENRTLVSENNKLKKLVAGIHDMTAI